MSTEFEKFTAEHDALDAQLTGLDARRSELEQQRGKLVNDLISIKKKRVAATVAGGAFADKGEIGKLTADIEILDDAIGELINQREVLSPKVDAVRGELRIADVESRLMVMRGAHASLAGKAEKAACELVTYLAAMGETHSEMATIIGELGPHNSFAAANFNSRVGDRLARKLAFLTPVNSFGGVTWPGLQPRDDEDWESEEGAAVYNEINGAMATARYERENKRPVGDEAVHALIAEDRLKPKGPAAV